MNVTYNLELDATARPPRLWVAKDGVRLVMMMYVCVWYAICVYVRIWCVSPGKSA